MEHVTTLDHESRVCPGVKVTLKRVSFWRRSELMKRLAPILAKARAIASTNEAEDLSSSGILRREILHILLEWGIVEVSGLRIDGAQATKETLLRDGPEELALEIFNELQRQLSLNETERKN